MRRLLTFVAAAAVGLLGELGAHLVNAIDDVLGLPAARVKEQARRRASDEDGNSDRQENSSGHQDEGGERVDLHGPMVSLRVGAEVGPKVTSTLGRRSFFAAAACSSPPCAPAAVRPSTESVPGGLTALGADPKNGIWPAQYPRAAAPVREAYSWAIAHEPTPRHMPCYCGCGADGHTSNYSCYVRSALAGGRAILDTHGFG